MVRIRNLEDEESANNAEDEESLKQRDHDCSSGDAVAARNGLWVTLRCRPYCAAAVKLEYTTWLSPRRSIICSTLSVKIEDHKLPLLHFP